MRRAAFCYAGSVVIFTLVGVLGWVVGTLIFPTGGGWDRSVWGPMTATAAAYGCVLSFLAPALLDRRLVPAMLILGGTLFVLWPMLSFALARMVATNPSFRGTQTMAILVPTLGYAVAVLIARLFSPPLETSTSRS